MLLQLETSPGLVPQTQNICLLNKDSSSKDNVNIDPASFQLVQLLGINFGVLEA